MHDGRYRGSPRVRQSLNGFASFDGFASFEKSWKPEDRRDVPQFSMLIKYPTIPGRERTTTPVCPQIILDVGYAEAGPMHRNKRMLTTRWTSTRYACPDCFQ
jgi:hypothetical protein